MQEKYNLMVSSALALGVIYALLGAIELATGLWNLVFPENAVSIPGVPVDLFGGFAALVTGATYLGGISALKGKHEALGYILVGGILSGILGILYLLIVGADGLSALLATWEGGEWTWEWLTSGSAGPGLLRPEILLLPVSFLLTYIVLRAINKEAKMRKSLQGN